jgi:hypothetical protein
LTSATRDVRFSTFCTSGAAHFFENSSCVSASVSGRPAANWQTRFSFHGECLMFFSFPTYVLIFCSRRRTIDGLSLGYLLASRKAAYCFPSSVVTIWGDVYVGPLLAAAAAAVDVAKSLLLAVGAVSSVEKKALPGRFEFSTAAQLERGALDSNRPTEADVEVAAVLPGAQRDCEKVDEGNPTEEDEEE